MRIVKDNNQEDKLAVEENTLDKGSKTKIEIKTIFREVIVYIILFVVCVFIIPRYIVQRTIVDGPSMENTLEDKDQLIVDKLSYQFSDPKRFDVIIFYPFGRDVSEYYVKRVIGLPGETIQIVGSDIYINGEVLEETYGKDLITDPGMANEEITLGSDDYFVLGDNREVSSDSRFEDVGILKRDLISGKVMFRMWPISKLGGIN